MLCVCVLSSYATVAGGASNTASGQHSVVLGSYGLASHATAGVLAFQGNTAAVCASQAAGTLTVCAPAGMTLNGKDVLVAPDIEALDDRATTLEAAFLGLQNWTTTVDADMSAIDSDVDALLVRAATLEAGVSVLDSGVKALESRATTLEGGVSQLDATTAQLWANASSQQHELDALGARTTSDVAGITADMALLLGNDSLLATQLASVEAAAADNAAALAQLQSQMQGTLEGNLPMLCVSAASRQSSSRSRSALPTCVDRILFAPCRLEGEISIQRCTLLNLQTVCVRVPPSSPHYTTASTATWRCSSRTTPRLRGRLRAWRLRRRAA